MKKHHGNYFVGVPIRSEYSKQWFSKWKNFHKGVRLHHPDDLHVTLAFLGRNVNETKLNSIRKYLDEMNSFVVPQFFTLQKPHMWPNTQHPLGIGLEIGENFRLLQSIVFAHRDHLIKIVGKTEVEIAIPHVTIAQFPRANHPNYNECKQSIWQWYENKNGKSYIPGSDCRILLDEIALYTWAEGYPNYDKPHMPNFQIVHRKKLLVDRLCNSLHIHFKQHNLSPF
ncbi:2'-5' RNA ligase [Reticulomyxa filosa]|uniref:2'-5' RNA ligase n=1 Tax=Reticulomyxa filosa TaxID=46433 RepID=X6MD48_RETFI|nr:2'-5' RNA ligase [Reticulomyxa filosa]|eukprot:ETO11596.1 2'-5' RNA ligase [Reticulomyxa filosa]